MIAHLLVGALAFNVKNAPVMKLRGGVSAEDAQNYLGYITLAQAVVGHAFTKESIDVYEFKSEIEAPTLAFAKFNYAIQIALAVNLLMPEYGITALAITLFASSSELCSALKSPKGPVLAWVAMLLGLQKYSDKVPAWLLPGMLLASGVHGNLCIDQCMEMYGVGVPLSHQSKTMAKLVNAGFAALGTFLLAPVLGYSSAQAFAGFALVFAAAVVKMCTLDGGADLFNVAGGYAWAAIFGGAGVAALMA